MTPPSPTPLLAGVELGGTKCVCIIGTGPDDVRDQVTIPTAERNSTLERINSVLDGWWTAHGPIEAMGLASFGPLDLRPQSRTFGHITSTVKPGWEGTDVIGRLGGHRGIPVAINTDVNGAALAEGRWGAAQGLKDFAYITVGTGVGVGLIVDGRPVFGCNHTELGHIRIARLAADTWPGICQFHGDCVEGLASGPAIGARAGMPGSQVPADSPVWGPVTHALGQLLHTMLLATAPKRILMGGGVVERRPELLAQVRAQFVKSLNGYLDLEDLTGGVDRYVVPPGLGALAGPLGSLALAADAVDSATTKRLGC
ncbi:MAG TPA: ROK family protein [Steroidobacteraceae bacterium]|nr:ROK family protein [Steroidobacteraceae bacterium]